MDAASQAATSEVSIDRSCVEIASAAVNLEVLLAAVFLSEAMFRGAGGVFSFRGLLVEVSLALVGVASPAYFQY